MNHPSQGVIAIQRPKGFFAAGLSDFVVRIDGQKIGRVERGGQADFTVDSGEHTVEVSMDWFWLRPRRVLVEPSSRTELAINARSGGAWKLCLPMFLGILVAVALLWLLRQSTSFTEANWLMRSAVCLIGFATIFASYLLVTRKLGRDYWDYWTLYTLEPAETAISNRIEPEAAADGGA